METIQGKRAHGKHGEVRCCWQVPSRLLHLHLLPRHLLPRHLLPRRLLPRRKETGWLHYLRLLAQTRMFCSFGGVERSPHRARCSSSWTPRRQRRVLPQTKSRPARCPKCGPCCTVLSGPLRRGKVPRPTRNPSHDELLIMRRAASRLDPIHTEPQISKCLLQMVHSGGHQAEVRCQLAEGQFLAANCGC